MKKGISGWAFIDRDPDACFALARKYGYDGVELVLGTEGPVRYESTAQEMGRLKNKAAAYGLELYSLVCDQCWTYSLTADDPTVREQAERMVFRQIELAAALGCETVLVLPGIVESMAPGGAVVPYDVCYNRAVAAVSRLASVAEDSGVVIGLENVWNKFLLSPLEMRDLIDRIGSRWVGAYVDVGNMVVHGYPEHWIRILDRRITKVHFKDYIRRIGTLDGFTDIGQGDVNYPAVMAALEQVGYDGWVTAEVFPDPTDPERILRISSEATDRILSR